MKIQTLCSLAAVGLAFAKPIHNLEERADVADVLKCAGDTVQKGLSVALDNVSQSNIKLEGLDGLISCITNAAAEVTDIATITQDPLGWLHSLDCTEQFLGGAEGLAELGHNVQQVENLLSVVAAQTVGGIVKCGSSKSI
ncbi:unnamed protein product [Aspergillus oryzae RIB40]|uniref:DNA, SC038 n=2 Tax=Aspergillus oryzae TaxID=5062 RepID=Q2U2K7_ASPOR|nr:unnamed protein product [Aspergillus oryzae RIB40]OOO09089.1 hypothetical protein OAory_01103850 [Aspergillus oryzae]BAE64208.1 unnamed protein product [Aspergillus oryzae RIB40]